MSGGCGEHLRSYLGAGTQAASLRPNESSGWNCPAGMAGLRKEKRKQTHGVDRA